MLRRLTRCVTADGTVLTRARAGTAADRREALGWAVRGLGRAERLDPHPPSALNGDRARYLNLTFACTWLSGEPYAADDESLDARWWPLAELPPMAPVILAADRTRSKPNCDASRLTMR